MKSLFLFGSAARDEARADSDIDLLVEFTGPATFDAFMDLKFYLEELLGRRVDLVTSKALKPRLRPSVEREAILVWASSTSEPRRPARKRSRRTPARP